MTLCQVLSGWHAFCAEDWADLGPRNGLGRLVLADLLNYSTFISREKTFLRRGTTGHDNAWPRPRFRSHAARAKALHRRTPEIKIHLRTRPEVAALRRPYELDGF